MRAPNTAAAAAAAAPRQTNGESCPDVETAGYSVSDTPRVEQQ